MIFRRIEDFELDFAYELHCEVVDYLLKKGIKQWLRPIDKNKLKERQLRKENFGLFINEKLEVFLSITKRKKNFEWDYILGNKETVWLNSVSVNIHNKNKGLGKLAILKAIEYLQYFKIQEVYLDCVINEGFLVTYYKNLGFELLSETSVTYKSGSFKLALMKKNINYETK